MRSWLMTLSICAFAPTALATQASAADAAGYVLSTSHCEHGCERLHDGIRIPVTRYDEVFPGDQLIGSRSDQRITLIYFNEQGPTPVSLGQAPYVVHARRPGWAVAAENFVETIRNGLSRSKASYRVLVTRGPVSGLKPMCLEAGKARIGDGTRMLGFAWYGSVPPYTVTVYDPSGSVLLRETNLMTDEFVKASTPLTLRPGRHRVTLSDGAGHVIERWFEVIRARDVPAPPPALIDNAAGPGTRDILRADWLAWTGSGQFCYEAYLSLIPSSLSRNAESDARAAQVEIRDFAQ